MTISALIIGDQHFKVNNISEVEEFIQQIEKIAVAKTPDFIVLLGDLLDQHEKIHTMALNKAYDFIDRLRKISKTYVLVGNHDMSSNQVFLTADHWLNALKEWEDVSIIDEVLIEDFGDFEFLFCPYVYNGRFKEAINTSKSDWTKVSCIFCHQEFKGCKMGAIISEDGDEWDETFPDIISGHIHKNQKIGSNIYYPGSSRQVSYGETDKNIVAFITFEENVKGYNLEEIEINLPRKKILYMDMEDVEQYNYTETKDKIKITISGNYEEFKTFKKTKKFKELSKQGVQVVFKTKKKDIKAINENIENYIANNNEENIVEFDSILLDLVRKEKNPYLLEIYEFVINEKIIDPNDVIYI